MATFSIRLTRAAQVALISCATLLSALAIPAQQTVPIVNLPSPEARSGAIFGNVFGVAVVANNQVIVNDGVHRQLVMLDDKLGNAHVIMDSVATGEASYGTRAKPFLLYAGDSELVVDLPSRSFQVLDPNGRILRAMALPRDSDIGKLLTGQSAADAHGNLYYVGAAAPSTREFPPQSAQAQRRDSAPLFRANFETRTVDTIAEIKSLRPWALVSLPTVNGLARSKVVVNPLVTVDEWTLTSDGTIAVVRGHDYHIDWLTSDGRWYSAPKMPFDWRRVTDDDKRALMDSARKAELKLADERHEKNKAGISGVGPDGIPFIYHEPEVPRTPLQVDFVPMNEIADYYPAVRNGAMKADLDGNVWIVPTTSAQSKTGELVYDVVDRAHGLKMRVRMPVGRSIAGFGRNGVVILMGRNDAGAWFIERTYVRARAATSFE